ncbi:MAG: phosphosulfolactate synthase [Deltaproteobacteria bacterium]|nr:phosphosulfolactate synthase [Deltaproteobacteria bacterium]
MNAFEMITIPAREEKPRKTGLTTLLDRGIGYHAALDLTEQAADYIDLIKLGWGTSRLMPEETIKKKIRLYRDNKIMVSNGGTILEIAYQQGKATAFLKSAKELGMDSIEVSNGVVTINKEDKRNLIVEAKDLGLEVFSEIGRKDPLEDAKLTLEDMVEEAKNDMAAGASKIIIEAREGGKGLGIYDDKGSVKEEMVKSLVSEIGLGNIIFEAPDKSQQVHLILNLGINVSLGNIRPEDAIPLETLRRGLRGDTLGKL